MLRSWNVDGHLVFPFFLLCLPSTFSSGQQSAFLMIFIYVSPGDHISSLQQERGASEWSLKKVSEWTWSSFLNNSSRFHYSDSHSRVRAVPAERHSWRIKKKIQELLRVSQCVALNAQTRLTRRTVLPKMSVSIPTQPHSSAETVSCAHGTRTAVDRSGWDAHTGRYECL